MLLCTPLFTSTSNAQIFFNNGAKMRVTPNGIVQINGSATNNTGMIDNDGTTTITNNLTNNDSLRGSGVFYLAGDWTNNSVFLHDGASNFVLNGTNQALGGTVGPTYWDLTITGGGNKTVNIPQRDDNQVDFTDGLLVTSLPVNYLTFSTPAYWINGSSISYVEGPCAKDMNSATEFTFPIGNIGHFNTGGVIAATDDPTTYRSQYHHRRFFDITSVKSPLVSVSNVHYWHFDVTSGTSDGQVHLYWLPGDYGSPTYITSVSDLRVARWDTTEVPNPLWVDNGQSYINPLSNYAQGDIISTNVTLAQFGTATTNRPFTLSSITADNPLPVELLFFAAKQTGSNVKIQWETASEINNLGFEVEREYPATGEKAIVRSYTRDEELQAKSRYGAEYVTTDAPPAAGGYVYSLYQRDADGTRTFVAQQNLTFNGNGQQHSLTASIFPNPARTTTNLQISLATDANVNIDLYDVAGRLITPLYSGPIEAGARNLTLDVSSLTPGLYTAMITSGSERVSRAIMVTR
jgi:hypothetical protein